MLMLLRMMMMAFVPGHWYHLDMRMLEFLVCWMMHCFGDMHMRFMPMRMSMPMAMSMTVSLTMTMWLRMRMRRRICRILRMLRRSVCACLGIGICVCVCMCIGGGVHNGLCFRVRGSVCVCVCVCVGVAVCILIDSVDQTAFFLFFIGGGTWCIVRIFGRFPSFLLLTIAILPLL